MRGVEITALRSEDEGVFSQYITETHHEKYILNDPVYRHWQFTQLLVARTGNNIIGHLGYRDCSYWMQQEVKVRVSMNLYIRSEYRSVGVGALLMRMLTDTDKCVLGSAYTDAVGTLISHLRPQWKGAGNLRRFLCFLNPHPMIEQFGIPAFARYSEPVGAVEYVNDVSKGFDEFWQHIRDTMGFTAVRDQKYLNWRFISHPYFKYQVACVRANGGITGYIVYRVEKSDSFTVARIVDLMFADLSVADTLLSNVLFTLQREGVHAVDYIMSGNWHDDALDNARFIDTAQTQFESFPILFSPLALKRVVINVGYDLGIPIEKCFFTKADSDQDRPNPQK